MNTFAFGKASCDIHSKSIHLSLHVLTKNGVLRKVPCCSVFLLPLNPQSDLGKTTFTHLGHLLNKQSSQNKRVLRESACAGNGIFSSSWSPVSAHRDEQKLAMCATWWNNWTKYWIFTRGGWNNCLMVRYLTLFSRLWEFLQINELQTAIELIQTDG